MTIPKSVTSIGYGLCSFCEDFAKIVVESGNASYVAVDGVLYNIDKTQLVMYPVGKDAQSFVFPETVESTARSSFRGCTNLTSVTFNNLLTTIGGYSFNECDNLEKVVIKKPVTTIGDCTFMGCSSLKIYCEAESKPEGWDSSWNPDNRPVEWGAVNPEGGNTEPPVESDFTYNVISKSERLVEISGYIGSSRKVVIPSKTTIDGVQYTIAGIDGFAFDGRDTLTAVTIPNSVLSIGMCAFQGCSGLTSIVIPSSITDMGLNAFYDCSNLTIYCEAESQPEEWNKYWNPSDRPVVWGNSSGNNNEEFKPEDFSYGIISFSKMTVEIDGYNGTSSNIVIPSTVVLGGDEFTIVSIADETFKDCDNLISVTLPSTITSIGDAAFQNCSNLESVSLPNAIESIGACTFAECGSLTTIEIPNSVTFIGNSAFAESGLTSVVIPNSVTEISSYAFRDCADLASVEIPNSVATIGMCAFENCSELGTVKIPSSVSSIGIKAFDGCDNATFECEVEAKPEGWDEWWNYNNRPVVWKNDSPGTAVAESAAAAVNIYAHGNTIVVENADDEIFVYDAMGKLVYRNAAYTVSTEIRINGTGIYVVKVGNTAKRVMVKD